MRLLSEGDEVIVGERVSISIRHYPYTLPSRPEHWHWVTKKKIEDGEEIEWSEYEPIQYPAFSITEGEKCIVEKVWSAMPGYTLRTIRKFNNLPEFSDGHVRFVALAHQVVVE